MNNTAATIYKKLTNLEREVQKLKLRAYFNLPKKKQEAATYSEESIMKALKSTRGQIWRERYAKRVTSLS